MKRYAITIIASFLVVVGTASAVGVFYYDSTNKEFVIDSSLKIANPGSFTLDLLELNSSRIGTGPNDSALFINGYQDVQIRIDSDQSDDPDDSVFKINNGGNSTIFTVDESGNVSAEGSLTTGGDGTIRGRLKASTAFRLGGTVDTADRGIIVDNGASTSWDMLRLKHNNATYLFKADANTSNYTVTFNIDNTGLKIGHSSGSRNIEFQTNNTTRFIIDNDGSLHYGSSATNANELATRSWVEDNSSNLPTPSACSASQKLDWSGSTWTCEDYTDNDTPARTDNQILNVIKNRCKICIGYSDNCNFSKSDGTFGSQCGNNQGEYGQKTFTLAGVTHYIENSECVPFSQSATVPPKANMDGDPSGDDTFFTWVECN